MSTGTTLPSPPNPSENSKALILQENLFEFNDTGTAMGTKMAVAFANIFMSSVETEIISQSNTQPLEWKRYIDDTEKSLNGVTKLCDNLGLKRIIGE